MQQNKDGVLDGSSRFFHTPSNIAKTAFFYMTCAGEYLCGPEYDVDRNNYNSYLIMYVRKGSGFILYENRSFPAKEGDVVFLNCHRPHRYYTDTGWETLWLHFDGNSSRDLFELVYDNAGVVIPMRGSPVVPRYLALLLDGLRHGRPLHDALASSYIHRMLTEILLLSTSGSGPDADRISPTLEAITYIKTNYSSRIQVRELAEMVKVSPFHFSRVFKKETGYSPYEYIIKTRIDNAKNLLKGTGLSVKEIAYRVGFQSESNFIGTFREKVSLTPNEFRNTPL